METVERSGWKLHAYVIMSNHYHLAVETPEPNLVDAMDPFFKQGSQEGHVRRVDSHAWILTFFRWRELIHRHQIPENYRQLDERGIS
jgi:REP element-mobilizing transposase RayT